MRYLLRRRWWFMVPWTTIGVVTAAGLLWRVLAADEDDDRLHALIMVFFVSLLLAASVLDVAASIWIRLDREGVWRLTMFGWAGIRWGEIQRVDRKPGIVKLISSSDRVVMHLDGFVDRAAILDVLARSIPPE